MGCCSKRLEERQGVERLDDDALTRLRSSKFNDKKTENKNKYDILHKHPKRRNENN